MDYSPLGFSVYGTSRQEYWSGLPFSSPGDLPNPEIKPASPAWQADSLPLSPLPQTEHNLGGYWRQVWGPHQVKFNLLSPCLFSQRSWPRCSPALPGPWYCPRGNSPACCTCGAAEIWAPSSPRGGPRPRGGPGEPRPRGHTASSASSERLSCEAAGPGLLRSRKTGGLWKAGSLLWGRVPCLFPDWELGCPSGFSSERGGHSGEHLFLLLGSRVLLSAGCRPLTDEWQVLPAHLSFGYTEWETEWSPKLLCLGPPGCGQKWLRIRCLAVPLMILFCTELLPSLEGQMCWLLCICCQVRVELGQKQGDGPR